MEKWISKGARTSFRKRLGNVVYDKSRGEFILRQFKKLNQFRKKMEVDVLNYNKLKTDLTGNWGHGCLSRMQWYTFDERVGLEDD